ncbi:hypothetical protein [Rhodococcus qingshengii]|uniref:hypothetical protein n=1 Tax=Rhodococcus qingshengii TaxID=334542 RepID=UPI00237C53B6|nr:hypothetical protein [Rhodococcus qingshengii]WCT05983.1 hypothetical protein PI247_29630 [Rhodococcus qingshengii]
MFDTVEGSDVSAIVGQWVEAFTVDIVAGGKPVAAMFKLGDRSLSWAAWETNL